MNLRRLLMVALLAATAGSGGCGAIAWVVAQAWRPKVPAAHEIQRDQTVLVLVDAPSNPLGDGQIKRHLSDRINQELTANSVGRGTIPYQQVLRLASSRPDFHRMAVADIGRELGADTVIYVEITDFSLQHAGGTGLWHPRLGARVLVLDVETGGRWPEAEVGGRTMPGIELPVEHTPSGGHTDAVVAELAERMGVNIARLFYPRRAEHHEDP